MPATYAALTHNGDPPQMEFIPTDSSHKYAKVTGESLIFKFADRSMLSDAKEIVLTRGFGLHRVTLRDLRTGNIEQAKRCETLDDFCDQLDFVGWCQKCRHFSSGIAMKRKCWKCKKSTQ